MVTINYLREENPRRAEMAAMKPSRGEAAILFRWTSPPVRPSSRERISFTRTLAHSREKTVPLIAIRRVGAREDLL